MVSVIVAVYNQLSMNRLFWDNLCQSTDNVFELIVIDNNSSDGTREFFQSLPSDIVTVIANDGNYSYPHCQNQGIEVARYDVLAFLNNDQLMSVHWDSRMMEVLGRDGHDVLSCASVDCMGERKMSHVLSKRWKFIKYPTVFLFGHKKFSLQFMVWLMYGGRFNRYCEKLYNRYGLSKVIGFSGSVIVMNRAAIDKIGMWDSTIQAADFDIFFRSVERYIGVGDIKPVCIVRGIYAHHYRRLTLKGEHYPSFVDFGNLRSLGDKWSDIGITKWFSLCDCNKQDISPDK